jgi:uncharacterized membrane protein YkvA (DUF1232 family)
MAGGTSWLSWPSLVRTLAGHVRLSWRLLREPGVPLITKVLPVVAVLYLLSPLDFIPDVLPIIGQLDDAGVLLLALEAFLKLCPEPLVIHHRDALMAGRAFSPAPQDAVVIDAEFHRDDSR